MYKISVLLPSAHPDKRAKFIQNLKETTSDFDSLEICVCLDGDRENWQDGNIKYTYHKPSPYISNFFEAAYRISTAPWILLGNDDIQIATKGWDQKLFLGDPYRLYHFRDNDFNSSFSCHPFTSRKVWELLDDAGLVFPNLKNMGCDTTLWDIMPAQKRFYIPTIEIIHDRHMDEKKRLEIEEDYKLYNTFKEKRDDVKLGITRASGLDIFSETKVAICLPTQEMARQAAFYDYFNMLDKPAGTMILTAHGQSPAKGRNLMIRGAIDNGCTHILFLDDDMAFQPDLLTKLLSHNVDIVTGLYLKRNFPHEPVIFEHADVSGRCLYRYLKPWDNGLVEIVNCGLGACLIKAKIFKDIEEPWIRLGELQSDDWCDDIGFFNRVRKTGYRLFCDTNIPVGHMASCIIWPNRLNGQWVTSYETLGKGTVSFPIAEAPKEIPELEIK